MIQYKEPSTDTRVNCSEVKDSRANLYLMKQQILEASIGGHEQEREGERERTEFHRCSNWLYN
jgi:hypothetical protein